MLKENLAYLGGRLLPAAITLGAVALYTHLIEPDEYGRYALYFLLANLLNICCFQWLRQSAVRFYARRETDETALKSSLLAAFVVLAGLSLIAAVIVCFLPLTRMEGDLPVIAILLGVCIAWAELNQDWLRAKRQALRFSAVFTARAALSVVFSAVLILKGYGVEGMLLGMCAGQLLPTLPLLRANWKGASLQRVERTLLRQLLSYGGPLTVTSSLNGLVIAVDKVVLAFFWGAAAVAPFAVAFDLAKGSLWTLAQGSNLAAIPRAARAYERKGARAAQVQLRHNLHFMLAILLPAALGLYLITPALCRLFLDPAYQAQVALLMPPVILGTVLSALKSFYADQAFQLRYTTAVQMRLTAITCVIAFVAAVALIPGMGAAGAGWSGVIAYGLTLGLSLYWGSHGLAMPMPKRKALLQLGAALALMTIMIAAVQAVLPGWMGLIAAVTVGGGGYLSVLAFCNYEGYLNKWRHKARKA